LLRDKRIIATGYNGPPEGAHHCEDNHCDLSKPCTHAVHAEANLIAFCAKHGIATLGGTLFVTTSPCIKCAELIVQSGISQVIFDSEYRDEAGVNMLYNAGVLLYKYDPTLKINWNEE
jgi:dCMP deaminase